MTLFALVSIVGMDEADWQAWHSSTVKLVINSLSSTALTNGLSDGVPGCATPVTGSGQ